MGETAAEIEARYLGMVPGKRAPKPPKTDGAPAGGPKRRGRKPEPWTLRRVSEACWAAPTVYLALLEAAAGASTCTPTRATLCDATGIRRLKTVSAALTVLESAGWIRRSHVPVTVGTKRAATLLRIRVLRKGQYAPSTGRIT